MKYFISFLKENCPYKVVDTCLMKSNKDLCEPTISCSKYVELDSRCKKYLRKVKINSINENII